MESPVSSTANCPRPIGETDRAADERILIMAPVGQDARAMAALLSKAGFRPQICGQADECAREVFTGAGALLMTEETLDQRETPLLLEALQAQPPWSELPVIILTSGGESRRHRLLDVAATAARAATLLERPLGTATLLRSVEVALNSRRRQYQVRDLFGEQQKKRRELEEAKQRADRELAERRLAESALGRWTANRLPYERRSLFSRYAVAILAVAIAVGLRSVLDAWLGREVGLITLYGMIALTMWYGGSGPAAFVTVVGYMLCDWLFIEPRNLFTGFPKNPAIATLYLATVAPIITFGLLLRRAQRHAQTSARVAIERQAQLQHEIEERQTVEEARARLAAIVTSSSDAIISKTLQGIVTSWNAAAQRIFGYAAEEMIGTPILRLIPPDLQDEEASIVARIRRGEAVEHYETFRLTKAGHRLPVSLTISPIRDATGSLIGASTIVRDVTGQRAAEEDLRLAKEMAEAASKAKDHFLAALSHELRTPLTPVLMTAAALRDDPRLSPDIREQLVMIERNVGLEARLIDDLLDLTRIARGKMSLRAELCDTHSLIGLVVEILREDAREKGLSIQLELNARHSHLLGDAARLQQVFWNLMRNAVKFTPASGSIHICTSDLPGTLPDVGQSRICIQVRDNGIGFAPEAAARIFNPFEQAAPGQQHRFGGVGLGLAIAQAIVDLHHGTIRAQSDGEGHGATFTVELPGTFTASPQPQPSSLPGSDGQHSPDGADREPPMCLLLVEDHEPTLQVLTRLLTRAGHQIVGRSTIADAREAARKQHFDAVISDLGLPDGTGIELMEGLRARHGLRGIVLSGYGMDEDLRRTREAGFIAHLVKPVDMNELRRALRKLAPR